MVTEAFRYVVHPAMYKPEWTKQAMGVFVEIDWDGERLSIHGVEGPLQSGNARGGAGQIVGHWDEDWYWSLTYQPGWNSALLSLLEVIWKKWHMNDMRAGCEHQRAEKWDKRPIDPAKPLNSYGLHFEGQRQPSWNMLTWVTPKEYPDGLLTVPCSTCGYKFGSAWLREEVPDEVLVFLQGLPRSTKQPAWV